MTKTLSSILLFALALCLPGCATPRQSYVSQHPELSAEHRKLIAAGVLADRDPVAGMTREQIRLTMGRDPLQVTKINGEDAWVWVKPRRETAMIAGQTHYPGSTGTGSFANMPKSDEPEQKVRYIIRTTVFFRGDVATHVDVTEELADRS